MDTTSVKNLLFDLLSDVNLDNSLDNVKEKVNEFLNASDSMMLTSVHFSINRSLTSFRWSEIMSERVDFQDLMSNISYACLLLFRCREKLNSLNCPEMFDVENNECNRQINEFSSIMNTLENLGF